MVSTFSNNRAVQSGKHTKLPRLDYSRLTNLDPKALDGFLGQGSDNPIDFAATLSGHRKSQIWCICQNNPGGPAISGLDISRRYHERLGHLSTFPRTAGNLTDSLEWPKMNSVDGLFVPLRNPARPFLGRISCSSIAYDFEETRGSGCRARPARSQDEIVDEAPNAATML
jgi:hypothetical protein